MDPMIRTLREVPSFPAVYAAALRPRPGVRRRDTLPETVLEVRSVRIDAARATAFDHLMGGPATELVHPGILHVLAFPVSLALMARGDFPFPLLGLVHLRNQLLQHRSVRVGESVDVQVRARGLQPHRRGTAFEAVSTISADGDIIATDVSTYLAKGRRLAGPAEEEPAPREAFRAPVPTARWSLPADAGRRYAEVSGDANPIHLSALTAKAFGFPRAIAHGMYTASRAFTESRVDLSRPLRWDVSFATPVMLPGTVLVRCEDDREAGTRRTIGWRPERPGRPAREHFTTEVTSFG
ncbi:MaoC family dehydratase [Brachybacterium hainanense]|uniref:MaoC family dehydratase n=1 Tax=Brachybacterium hainanense TaxID=1541174 RepID=A0ABV6R7X2_9MICO